MAGEYIRNTQIAVEVLRSGSPSMRNTQLAVEVLRSGAPSIRNTQTAIEVLRATIDEEVTGYIYAEFMHRR